MTKKTINPDVSWKDHNPGNILKGYYSKPLHNPMSSWFYMEDLGPFVDEPMNHLKRQIIHECKICGFKIESKSADGRKTTFLLFKHMGH